MCNDKKTQKQGKSNSIEESNSLILVHWLIVDIFFYKSILFLKKNQVNFQMCQIKKINSRRKKKRNEFNSSPKKFKNISFEMKRHCLYCDERRTKSI